MKINRSCSSPSSARSRARSSQARSRASRAPGAASSSAARVSCSRASIWRRRKLVQRAVAVVVISQAAALLGWPSRSQVSSPRRSGRPARSPRPRPGRAATAAPIKRLRSGATRWQPGQRRSCALSRGSTQGHVATGGEIGVFVQAPHLDLAVHGREGLRETWPRRGLRPPSAPGSGCSRRSAPWSRQRARPPPSRRPSA